MPEGLIVFLRIHASHACCAEIQSWLTCPVFHGDLAGRVVLESLQQGAAMQASTPTGFLCRFAKIAIRAGSWGSEAFIILSKS